MSYYRTAYLKYEAGSIKVWDTRQKTPVVNYESTPGSKADCWAVCFG